MNVLVISDKHGDIENLNKVFNTKIEFSLIIHLGDYFRDAQRIEEIYPNIKVEYIYGNSDFMIGEVFAEKTLEINGVKLFLTHGHRYSVKWDYSKLYTKAEELSVDALLFGHTHIPYIEDRGSYKIINPGSLTDSSGEDGESYAVLEIVDKKINAKIFRI